jgi:hypothetical protein
MGQKLIHRRPQHQLPQQERTYQPRHAFTFSTPASANTTGVVSEGVAPRLASPSTATLFTGANVSAMQS